ncbi:MAG: VTT domain-containing protein [Chromatiaceae bacterium]
MGSKNMRYFQFKAGRNCWRVARAKRLAVLVDGEDYFAAVRRALIAAERRIFILAWDIDSRLALVREEPGDGLPTTLADLLKTLLDRKPELEIFVLVWDYAPIYALEREPLFFGNRPWDGHDRLHFCEDDKHPLAASQHQKLVVVDGVTAFCGGFDLSKWRWDTSAHLADDPRRVDASGDVYGPFHDVQMLVDGDAAQALEALARQRWQIATGESLEPLTAFENDPWPAAVPLFQDGTCAIARTLPRYNEREEVVEVERLYIDMIDAAERFIYAENQYLTSTAIRDALARRLRQRHGPEVVIVLPKETGDWLEQHTMDVLRARVLTALREADAHGRLRVYYPAVPGLSKGALMVHAKLMIVDDRLLRVGSSNLSNRSMGLDSECDLCAVSADKGDEAAIASLRRRLLAMFLDKDPEQVANAETREGSLIAAVESLRGDDRSLAPLSGDVDPEWERQLPDARLVDPERPLSPSAVSDAVIGNDHLPHARRRFWFGSALVLLLLVLAAAWRWTPLGDVLEPGKLAAAVTSTLRGPWAPVLLMLGFVFGTLVAVPVTLLILVTALVHGAAVGAAYALAGSTLAAATTYGLGSYLGRPTVERLSGGSLHRLSERLARRGILTIITVRVVPVAPFTVVNLFAGASHIRFRDYLIGTVVGMLPGVAAMSIFAEGILGMIQGAKAGDFLVIVLGLLFLVGFALLARRLLALASSETRNQA